MPVSGLVLSLSDEPQRRSETLAAIDRDPRITMGSLEARRLAIVIDTNSRQQDRHLWDWLSSLSGVSLIEVAFVGFDQPEDSSCQGTAQVSSANSDSSLVTVSKDDSQDGR